MTVFNSTTGEPLIERAAETKMRVQKDSEVTMATQQCIRLGALISLYVNTAFYLIFFRDKPLFICLEDERNFVSKDFFLSFLFFTMSA